MLFEEQKARKPNLYPWTQDFISSMWAGHWTPNEFNFKSDVHDFKVNLTEQEQEVIKRSLAAIAQIEISVKKFWARLGDNFKHPSINDLGYVMANIEVIHNIAYEKLLMSLGFEDIFEKNLKLQVIEGRDKYLKKYNHKYYEDSKKQYIYAIILFTLYVENVSLFSQFYVINWFNRYRNVLKDTGQQILYTAKEELIHALVGIKLVNVLREEYPELFDKELEDRILHETEEAFKAESKIIDWIVGDYNQDKLNAELLKEFIKNRLNESISQIGFTPCLTVNKDLIKQTSWFDEDILGNNMTDFFFRKPTEYTKKNQAISEDTIF